MSSSYLNIGAGGPEAAMSMAMKVKASGDDFVEKAQALVARIVECEHGAPWGQDKYGEAFNTNYTVVPEGAKLAANEALRTSLSEAATTLSDMGNRVVEAMAKYGALEAENAKDIGGTVSA
ncbi:hypothetical protein GCM10009682_11040 [Luedemannella flava]|uniref:WXG100 family type VII secretion target n=1 Tax=Luedemannella flava TaxID=349316 RepID=A0ABN2LJN4_9ACTN